MKDLIYSIVMNGEAAVSWALAALAAAAVKYLVSRIDNETARRIAERAIFEIEAAVREVAQTYTRALKEANADGVLTDAEKTEAKKRAVDTAKANIGQKGLARLAKALGLEDVEKWLGNKIEAAVGSLPSPAPNSVSSRP